MFVPVLCYMVVTFNALMALINKKDVIHVMAAIILYAIVLVYQGYQYGQGDQTQILPCLWAQDHPGTYADDHYVRHYLSSGINERTIFQFLLRHLGYDQPWIVWGWHFLAGVALILAWIYIAAKFIKNTSLQWLCIAMVLTLGFHTSTGSNEIYYNLFIPSLPAKALASWAVFYWLNEKYFRWSALLILAGLLQPLVGIQVFLLTTVALIIEKLFRQQNLVLPWKEILLYIAFSLPWYIALALNNGSHDDPVAFMDIMEFRLSHHFFASYFGWMHLMLGALFLAICFFYYAGKLKWFFISILVGCLIYEIGVEFIRLPFALYTQWWKTTIWSEAFAFVAIFAMLEKFALIDVVFKKRSFLFLFLFLAIISIYRLSGFFGSKPEYMLPWSSSDSDEVNISELAGHLTPPSAVFIVPPELTAFRWYSKRDLFVDYKSMIHTKSFLKDWYASIKEAFEYDLNLKKSGLDFKRNTNQILAAPSADQIERWKKMGITHLISSNPPSGILEVLGKNSSYSILKLP